MAIEKKITMDDFYIKQAEHFYELVMKSDQSWRKSWASEAFLQRNGNTDKAYSNRNQVGLFKVAINENYEDPRWLTFLQAKEAGYKIKKGAKASTVFRIITEYNRVKKDKNNQPLLDENGNKQTENLKYNRPIMKEFYVFNANDIEGIPAYKIPQLSEDQIQKLKQEQYQRAEEMIRNFAQKHDIELREQGSAKAFYLSNNGVNNGKIVVPLKAQFNNIDDYFSVLFHETAHSSKVLGIRIHKETDTPNGNRFGSKNYAKEELTAELTALLLCKQFGIDSSNTQNLENNSLAYLRNWIKAGTLNKEDFIIAFKEANRSANVIYKEAPKVALAIQNDKIDNKLEEKKQKSLKM